MFRIRLVIVLLLAVAFQPVTLAAQLSSNDSGDTSSSPLNTAPRAPTRGRDQSSKRPCPLTGNYVAGALAIALIASIVMYVAMRIGDVPYAAGLAVLVFVLDLIPMVGATIAACVVMLVALTVSTETAVAMGIVALIYQQIENNITQPLVQRKTVSLSPFLVMSSVIVGSALLGVLGALLAVPGAAAIKVIAQEFLTLPGYVEPSPSEPEP